MDISDANFFKTRGGWATDKKQNKTVNPTMTLSSSQLASILLYEKKNDKSDKYLNTQKK